MDALTDGGKFHQSLRDPQSNRMVFPSDLFSMRKAKVCMLICSRPGTGGKVKASAGTTQSVVVFMACTVTTFLDFGMLSGGGAMVGVCNYDVRTNRQSSIDS